MRMVVVRLRFTTPCLGNIKDSKQGGRLCHLRDGQGRVVFLQSWWDSAMTQAARAYGRHGKAVRKIRWSPIVDGVTHVFTRYYKKDMYRKHEAFRAGDEIAVKAMVPTDIPTADFRELVSVLGEYFGISPFRHPSEDRNRTNDGRDGGFGRFEVVGVKVHENHYKKEAEHAGDQSSDASPAPPDTDADLQAYKAQVRPGAAEGEESGDGDRDVPVPPG